MNPTFFNNFKDLNQSQALADLHAQIESCDIILGNMENLLSGFQADLGNISSEIQVLQEQSISMKVKLENRKHVQEKLSKLLEGLVIPPDMIRCVSAILKIMTLIQF
jgi:hypothetical protein